MNLSWIKGACVFLLFGLCGAVCRGQGAAYAALYPNDCKNATTFYTEHKSLFDAAAQQTGLASQFLFAVVAPELTQYSYLRNKLESYSLKVFYVQHGKSYANFSIGYFQMKPSFVEQMEATLSADSLLRAEYASCLFAHPDERASRVARIDRLNTVEWQIKYLSLFCEIVQRKFSHLTFSTEEEKLRFYASAYNSGFHKSEQQIKETAQKALFPHFSKRKFSYADISVWFYKENHLFP